MIIEVAVGIVVGFLALAFLPYIVGLVVMAALAVLPLIPLLIGVIVSAQTGNTLGFTIGLMITAAIYYHLRSE